MQAQFRAPEQPRTTPRQRPTTPLWLSRGLKGIPEKLIQIDSEGQERYAEKELDIQATITAFTKINEQKEELEDGEQREDAEDAATRKTNKRRRESWGDDEGSNIGRGPQIHHSRITPGGQGEGQRGQGEGQGDLRDTLNPADGISASRNRRHASCSLQGTISSSQRRSSSRTRSRQSSRSRSLSPHRPVVRRSPPRFRVSRHDNDCRDRAQFRRSELGMISCGNETSHYCRTAQHPM
ncbi:hypothetical protein SARC_09162 [Sphaeroforma arctica JP610]|uniref:Uncharacterized protein n=1 Tax=Sphaeroforma arctica JP610 TaxID=667725 RepID=A0A0L0FQW4_9EUKA|nr:hypothetical protein SARC_09162 [Sphaeroforma arctica JP610]KNC78403.1 hypothetical protein SARC_09162 [Sphaeroforma arctica JP610]|eukprot:XP_014152305.1 hypothetical protein SARC_09162 [Sphaeroforma arctica JP610]